MAKDYINNRLHRTIQNKILSIIASPDVVLEYKVGSHIADVYWPSQKTVFEVQCSPISLNEAKRRTEDFEKLNLNIIWILHQKTFNKKYMSRAEMFLLGHKRVFYSNISQAGEGIIFDQEEALYFNKRLYKSPPNEIFLHLPYKKAFSKRTLFKGELRSLSWIKRMKENPYIWKMKGKYFQKRIKKILYYYYTAFKWLVSLG
jgi:competence CoiA-like predicted nuclease